MSNKTSKIKKTINKELFLPEMYNNILGSFLISLYILKCYKEQTPKGINTFYKKEKERWINGDVNEETWMQDICTRLNKNSKTNKENVQIPYGYIALLVSDYNRIIVPIFNGVPLSLRKDGWKGYTHDTGKVFLIKEKEK